MNKITAEEAKTISQEQLKIDEEEKVNKELNPIYRMIRIRAEQGHFAAYPTNLSSLAQNYLKNDGFKIKLTEDQKCFEISWRLL